MDKNIIKTKSKHNNKTDETNRIKREELHYAFGKFNSTEKIGLRVPKILLQKINFIKKYADFNFEDTPTNSDIVRIAINRLYKQESEKTCNT